VILDRASSGGAVQLGVDRLAVRQIPLMVWTWQAPTAGCLGESVLAPGSPNAPRERLARGAFPTRALRTSVQVDRPTLGDCVVVLMAGVCSGVAVFVGCVYGEGVRVGGEGDGRAMEFEGVGGFHVRVVGPGAGGGAGAEVDGAAVGGEVDVRVAADAGGVAVLQMRAYGEGVPVGGEGDGPAERVVGAGVGGYGLAEQSSDEAVDGECGGWGAACGLAGVEGGGAVLQG
jgi:hypothetical protein